MKASELRIGNWVINKTYPDDENPVQIDTLHDFFDQYPVEKINGEWTKNIEPIPLTEEWLLKVGFVRSNKLTLYYDFIDLRSGWFGLIERDGCYKFSSTDGSIGEQFYYVHQLQNLYFALTGEEITIKAEAV